MEAARIHAWGGELVLEPVPEPRPGPGEVLVQVLACGVGLTVLNCIRGHLGADPNDLPRVPGHELVGRIVETGPGVDPSRRGELVSAYFYLFCGRCARCLAGQEDLCLRLEGWIGVDRDGGYAQLVALPERNAISLPPGLDPVEATVIADAVATPVHVSHLARLQPGDRVAVIAAGGGLGIHMVQVARLFGAEVVGLETVPAKRRHLEQELQIPTLDSTDFHSVRLPSGWEGGADVVIDFLGRRESLSWGLDALGPYGRLVTLTTFPGVDFPVSPRQLVFSQLAILGSRYATRGEFELAARLVAEGRVRPVIGRREALSGVRGIHDDLEHGRLLGRGALVWPDPAS
ncbi:MAG TPA: alcohol dehydrogenase catalytic domain-containing protein [Candidatus Dormibacteraeota bacterium]|jgi:D-arabinose 1-dehydrogenase-like Zn-dependent alcohol dehydrogenase|nr:alcohol dehydrogenase catalytic domain-containing protein [Candidatus Dormibacteraeota bacterium]